MRLIVSLESSTPKLELIQVADVVAREKGIQRDEVIEAMEQPFKKLDAPSMEMSTIFKRP